MKKYEYCDVGFTFMRVTKTEAAAAYRNRLPIILCPVNLRPGGPWHPEVKIIPDGKAPFEAVCRWFRFFDCTNAETGRYIAYYIPVIREPDILGTVTTHYDYRFLEETKQ